MFRILAAFVTLLLSLPILARGDDAELARLTRDARAKDVTLRRQAYNDLLRLGADARPLLERLLREAEKKANQDIEAFTKGTAASGLVRELKKQIATAREEALAIIFDRKLYPDDAHGAIGQPKVDEKVGNLRTLWQRPSALLSEREPEVLKRVDDLTLVLDYLYRADLKPLGLASVETAWQLLDAAFDPVELLYSKAEREDIDDLYDYNATSLSSATDEERAFARILNDYRLMLGLGLFELDDRLVVASRKHSQEMQDLDYFAHESPVEENRTPGMRAQKEGFPSGALENCAWAPDAQGAFNGWYGSSGHHRGMLSKSSKLLGAGQSIRADGSKGVLWTMMAGNAPSLRGSVTKKNPRLTFLSRRERLKPGDVKSRWKLAGYCFDNEMPDEGRQVLEDLLTLDPEHKGARKRLGHVLTPDGWMTAEQSLTRAIEQLSPADALAEVKKAQKDEEGAVRIAALRAGERLGVAGIAVAEASLKDPASEVRVAACESLARLGVASPAEAKGSIAQIRGLLGDKSFYAAHAAAAALYQLGDRSGIPTLFAGLRNPDLSHRIDAHRQGQAMFGRDFGYRWDLPDIERAKVVDQWEAWVKNGQREGDD